MRFILFSLILACTIFTGINAMAREVILPHRILDYRSRTIIDFEGLLERCSKASVVVLGEKHDDPATHLFELAMLQGIHRMDSNIALSMEMFERDVQSYVDAYLAGEITEEKFLASSRPWGNYSSDYKPLVEFARENHIYVIASNVPRPLASRVAKLGISEAEFTDEERQWMAPTFEAPEDEYWNAFIQAMQMPGMHAMNVTENSMRFYYEAQVLKDEAMADSISGFLSRNPDKTVLHVTGAFHISDYLGTYSRLKRNLPDADVISILVLPVDNLLDPIPDDVPAADFIVLVLAQPEVESEKMTTPPMPPDPQTQPSSNSNNDSNR